jgi:hypothetical protein
VRALVGPRGDELVGRDLLGVLEEDLRRRSAPREPVVSCRFVVVVAARAS